MENVKNMVSKTFTIQFIRWVRVLEDLGYTNTWQVLNAANYGSCQARERVFLVSILGDNENSLYHFPRRLNQYNDVVDYLDSNVDDKYYLSQDETQSYLNKVALDSTVAKTIQTPVNKVVSPLTANGFVPTLMATGYESASHKNMISTAYYPKPGVLEIF